MFRLPRWFYSLAMLAMLCNQSTWAGLMGATSAPKQADISIEDGRTIHIRWIVSSSPAHTSGAFSAQATLKDSATDTLLKTIELPLNAAEGAGPFQFEETLTLSPDEIKQWHNLGYQKLEFKRAFTSGGDNPTTSSASIWLNIFSKQSGDAPTYSNNLVVHNVALRFKPQRFNTQVSLNLPLQAQLTVNYSGQGKFNGSWQLAEISDTDKPLTYTSLATVSKQLKGQQRDFTLSPKLPTDKPGRFLIRFCANQHNPITNQISASDNQCPNPELSSSLSYQVVQNPELQHEIREAPALAGDAVFEWPAAAPGVVVYELQLHQLQHTEIVQSSEFVARMLIPQHQTSTQLSGDIIAMMTPGSQYRWQVTGLDQHGDPIQQTAPHYFVYLP